MCQRKEGDLGFVEAGKQDSHPGVLWGTLGYPGKEGGSLIYALNLHCSEGAEGSEKVRIIKVLSFQLWKSLWFGCDWFPEVGPENGDV